MPDRALNAADVHNSLTNSDLGHRVKLNLDLHHLWTNLSLHRVYVLNSDAFQFLDDGNIVFVQGQPPDKLYATDSTEEDGVQPMEWVLPVRTESTWSLRKWVAVFESLEAYQQSPVKRILMGLYTEDSTVVYYFVHNSLIKPRRN
ncbi:tRNA-splicing endonuclease subunit Sen15 [Limtongia smithiae]|uniref:tRNA-splicing endonuclease subunit Sen15 n=1 Tax=Limtongia smithiae TaxID=1125753 RepID=UPI0034CFC9C1